MTVGGPRGRRPVVVLVAAGALGLVALGGCGSSGGGGQAVAPTSSAVAATSSAGAAAPSSSTSSSSGGGMPATATTLMIEEFAYTTPASVPAGATVSVMNMDGEAHTVTADSGDAFDVASPPDRTVTFTAPSKPGRYPFHCTYHGGMHGVLVVT